MLNLLDLILTKETTISTKLFEFLIFGIKKREIVVDKIKNKSKKEHTQHEHTQHTRCWGCCGCWPAPFYWAPLCPSLLPPTSAYTF